MKKMMHENKNIEKKEKVPEERDLLMQTLNNMVD